MHIALFVRASAGSSCALVLDTEFVVSTRHGRDFTEVLMHRIH